MKKKVTSTILAFSLILSLLHTPFTEEASFNPNGSKIIIVVKPDCDLPIEPIPPK